MIPSVLLAVVLGVVGAPFLRAEPGEAELERWLESDEPLPPSVSTEHVNEGALRFLPEPPDKPVHHHAQRLEIRPSSLEDGWVRMRQCHRNLDRVPATEIVFREGRVRDLVVTKVRNIGQARVVGASVQLEDVAAYAEVCLAGWTRALQTLPGGAWQLVSGPYMRRFLDGYYPLRASLEVVHGGAGITPVSVDPDALPGWTVVREADRIRFDGWFEGRLEVVIRYRLEGVPEG